MKYVYDCLCCFTALFFLLCYCPVLAENSPAEPPATILNNIGFIQNPGTLHKKYSMCEAFLKVEWIDTKKKIGYTQYEITVDKTGEKKTVWALVTLNDEGTHYLDWDIYAFRQADKLDGLFSFIRRARVVSQNLAAMELQDDNRKQLFHRMNITNDASIAGYRQTICLVYPDEELAWIVEGKSVENGLKDLRIVNQIEKAAGSVGVSLTSTWAHDAWILDFNHDGKIDFVKTGVPIGVVYSVGNSYYDNTRRFKPEGSRNKVLIFQPFNNECFVQSGIENLTTDGKYYYFGRDCNITKLTYTNDKE